MGLASTHNNYLRNRQKLEIFEELIDKINGLQKISCRKINETQAEKIISLIYGQKKE
jgi:hypothetical protein